MGFARSAACSSGRKAAINALFAVTTCFPAAIAWKTTSFALRSDSIIYIIGEERQMYRQIQVEVEVRGEMEKKSGKRLVPLSLDELIFE